MLPVPVGSVGYQQTHRSEEEKRVLPELWDLTEKG